MKLLGFDTSTDACTVGLLLDDDLSVRHQVEARAHTRDLLPMIRELLAEGSVGVGDLDAIVLGNGPGSFIGMRIGASVAQGLAFGADRPLVPVSSLEVIAAEVFQAAELERVLVAQDARMGEVYLQAFARDGDLPVADAGPTLHRAADPLAAGGVFAVAGAGWSRYPELKAALPGSASDRSDIAWPHARHLLSLGLRDFAAGRACAPDALEPAYVRHTVAAVPR